MAKKNRKKKHIEIQAMAVPYLHDFSPVDPYYLYDLNGVLTVTGVNLAGCKVDVRFWNKMLPTGNYVAADILIDDPYQIACRRFSDAKTLEDLIKNIKKLKAPTCDEIEVTVTNSKGQHSSKRKPIIL